MAGSALDAGGKRIQLLPALTIGVAVGATGTVPVVGLYGMHYLLVEAAFLYGAGGTSVKCYVQTSIDGGVTWADIMSFAFTTSAGSKVSAVRASVALAAAVAPTDGSLADNTILDGLLGDRLRLKYVTTGTYTGATSLAVNAVARV